MTVVITQCVYDIFGSLLLALYVQGKDVTKYASMCKLKGGRLAREVADKCLQYWGGMGFTNEVLISRFYRYATPKINLLLF